MIKNFFKPLDSLTEEELIKLRDDLIVANARMQPVVFGLIIIQGIAIIIMALAKL